MKVLLLSAGNSIHTLRWANAYCAQGAEVHLVTEHVPLAGYDPAIQVHRLPHYGGLGYVLNGPRLARLLRAIKPDVVNAHYATGYGTLARWCGAVPLVLNVWGSDVHAFPEKGMLHRWWLRRNLRAAQHIVSTSKAMAQRTYTLLRTATPITVVPFGVDMEQFQPREESGKDSTVTIGTVKTLEHHYGVDLLVEAFIALCKLEGLPPLRLRVVGGGSERATLEGRVQECGLAAQVEFVGAVPHERVPEELGTLDIYVALSREESFGVAVVEAQACGKPVVVSDVGGLPEVVKHGTTGTVVPSGNVAAATQALEELVRDAGSRERMGTAARAWVVERYEWKHCVEGMMSVLRAVVAERRT